MTSGAAERLDFVEQALLASGQRLDFFCGAILGSLFFGACLLKFGFWEEFGGGGGSVRFGGSGGHDDRFVHARELRAPGRRRGEEAHEFLQQPLRARAHGRRRNRRVPLWLRHRYMVACVPFTFQLLPERFIKCSCSR